MSEMVLTLPSNYVDIDRDQMEYVEGGGTFSVTFTNSFLSGCAAAFVGGGAGAVAAVVASSLAAQGVIIGGIVTAATAGTGVWIATIIVGALSALGVYISGYIAQRIVQHTNYSFTKTVASAWYVPNYNLKI